MRVDAAAVVAMLPSAAALHALLTDWGYEMEPLARGWFRPVGILRCALRWTNPGEQVAHVAIFTLRAEGLVL